MNQKIAPKHYDTIIEMRNDGATYVAIAEFFGVTDGTIEAIMAKVKQGRTGSKKEPPTEDELYQLYIIDDRRQHDIANEYGVGRRTVSRWLKEAGIKKYVDEWGEKQVHNKYDTPEDDELYQLYIVDEMSQVQLMAHYGVSRTTIYKWLADAEITKRGPYNKGESR